MDGIFCKLLWQQICSLTELLLVCRYTKDLPAGVTRMNDECLKLKDHTAGYQTVEDIQRVVTEAIGGRTALSNERLIDEVMVRLPSEKENLRL